jgi:hypothetical protein
MSFAEEHSCCFDLTLVGSVRDPALFAGSHRANRAIGYVMILLPLLSKRLDKSSLPYLLLHKGAKTSRLYTSALRFAVIRPADLSCLDDGLYQRATANLQTPGPCAVANRKAHKARKAKPVGTCMAPWVPAGNGTRLQLNRVLRCSA